MATDEQSEGSSSKLVTTMSLPRGSPTACFHGLPAAALGLDYVAKRKAEGDGNRDALRALKWHLSDVVSQALRADELASTTAGPSFRSPTQLPRGA
jgi:hypothetical protein